MLLNLGSVAEAEAYKGLKGLSGNYAHGAASPEAVSGFHVARIPHKVIIGKDGMVFKNYEDVSFTDVDALL